MSDTVIMMVGRYKFGLREFSRIIHAVTDLQYVTGGYRGSLSKTTTGWEPMNAIDQMMGRAYRNNKNFLNFLYRAGGDFRATEKRDMVYAFLGLLSKPNLFDQPKFTIKPDYSASLRDVYIDLARSFIEGTQRLDILGRVSGHEPVCISPYEGRCPSCLPCILTATISRTHETGRANSLMGARMGHLNSHHHAYP